MTDNDPITVRLAKFTRLPGARYKKDSKGSAEEFREEFLSPAFKRAVSEGKKLVVDLDGVAGIAASFMEEAFGGLAREHGGRKVLSTVRPYSADPHGRDWVEEAELFMAEENQRQVDAKKQGSGIPLAEFKAYQDKLMVAFLAYWEKGVAQIPEYYPKTMTLSEWWEQTIAFEDGGWPQKPPRPNAGEDKV